jgi:hypothetical protein
LREIRVDPNTGQTGVFIRIKGKVDVHTEAIKNQIIRWEHKPASLGLEYSGTMQDLFWKTFDPCLENAARTVLDEVGKEYESRAAIKEAGWLLESMVREVYRKMTDVDQRMRGKGYPQSVSRVNKQFEMECMIEKVRAHVKAATALYSR